MARAMKNLLVSLGDCFSSPPCVHECTYICRCSRKEAKVGWYRSQRIEPRTEENTEPERLKSRVLPVIEDDTPRAHLLYIYTLHNTEKG